MARRTPRTRRNPVPFTPEQQAAIDALPVWIHNAYTGERLRPATREEYRSSRPGRNAWDKDKRMVSVGYGESEVFGEPYADGRPSFLDDLGLRLVTRHSKELLGTSTQEEYEAWRDQTWDDRRGIFVERPDIPRHAVTWAGFPWPRKALLYHATRALGPISQEGFKTRKQGTAAMGGGRHVYSISLTLLPERAVAFALAFDTLARVAQGKMSLQQLVDRLRTEAPRSFAAAKETYWNVRELYSLPDTIALFDEGRVLVLCDDGGTGYRKWARPQEVQGLVETIKASRPGQHVRVITSSDAAFELYSDTLGGRFRGEPEVFNPVLMGTDMAALARTPLSDIGIVVARTSIPRICAEVDRDTASAASRLGYTLAGDNNRFAFSHHECEQDIEDEIEASSGGGRTRAWSTPQERRDAFANRYMDDPPYARLDTNFKVGERTPETTMVFNEGEEEVRIFDPSKIEIVETWDMATIRRKFNLGDRIALPAFNSRERDISLWPLLKDEPPMRENSRHKRRRNGLLASKEERERREKSKSKAERGLDTARTAHTVASVGIVAARAAAPRAAATVGLRAIPYVGEALMVAGAGKEAYKVAKRRRKEGWKSGSWKTDLSKVGAGALGLEDFVADAPKKNPLTFDNRAPLTPELRARIGRAKDRVLASALAPAKHRAIEEATAHSPHNFRVVLVRKDTWGESRMEFSNAGAVTLRFSVGDYTVPSSLALRSREPRPKSEEVSVFTAFTYLHRFGDNIAPFIMDIFWGRKPLLDDFLAVAWGFQEADPSTLPADTRANLMKAFARLVACHEVFVKHAESMGLVWAAAQQILHTYAMTHINSKMVREHFSGGDGQAVADLFPLCELTSPNRPLFLPFDAERMEWGEPEAFKKTYLPLDVATCNAYGKHMNVAFREFYDTLIPALYGSVWDI